jgi:hypothetical protein
MTQLKDGGRQPRNREERSLSASTVVARRQGSGWDEPCKLRGLRTVVCPGKASMFSRGQTCRGRSQSPVVRIAEEMETKPSKPIDKISPGEVTSHRAVTKVNALWPRE